VCVFFFQAEDGIRYWSVTGVQTCALPIFEATAPGPAVAVNVIAGSSPALATTRCSPIGAPSVHVVVAMPCASEVTLDGDTEPPRSEERRVGKEGRAGRGRGR